MRDWLDIYHPSWRWLWYRPWHWFWHLYLGHENGYHDYPPAPKFFCHWCAGRRLYAWATSRSDERVPESEEPR